MTAKPLVLVGDGEFAEIAFEYFTPIAIRGSRVLRGASFCSGPSCSDCPSWPSTVAGTFSPEHPCGLRRGDEHQLNRVRAR